MTESSDVGERCDAKLDGLRGELDARRHEMSRSRGRAECGRRYVVLSADLLRELIECERLGLYRNGRNVFAMKIKKRNYVLGLVCSVLPAFANAEGWTDPGYITRLWSQPNGSTEIFSVQLTLPEWNPDGCDGGNWYRISAEASGYKTAVSLLMSAQAQGKRVKVYLSGCTFSYPKIVNVILYD